MEVTLKSKLQEKLAGAIESNRLKVQNNFMKFSQTIENMNDNVLTINGIRPFVHHDFDDNKLTFIHEDKHWFIHPNALNQMSAKLNVPTGYINALAASEDSWKKNLVSKILSQHLYHSPKDKILIRSVGDEMRGYLSAQYKRLNSSDIISTYLRTMQKNDMITYDFYFGDTKYYIETVNPDIIDIETEKQGTISVCIGTRLRNSDFGCSALELSTYLLQVVCLNGAVKHNALKEIHLGAKLSTDIEYSEQTYKLNTEATLSALNDTFAYIFTPDYMEKNIMSIKKASDTAIQPVTELKILSTQGILKSEIKDIENMLMNNRTEDGLSGEMSLWKFAQAISAVARDKNDERKRELENISGKLIDRVWIN